eukprot:TRINITY_DN15407_c0_g2_i2.p1 TRINITY_DN15407_c0_g2~~TRINITY_DN15407_c0_g2_i2.p1  ORF type:complete len:867 (+),score=111.64 TRINITY_DN15407_c0_g2_i2:76-2601(+)
MATSCRLQNANSKGQVYEATFDGALGRVEDEPVFLHFRSAIDGANISSDMIPDADTRARVDDYAEPHLTFKVMPFHTWQAVPDANIRFLYKGIELRNDKMVDDYNFDLNKSDGKTAPRDGTSAEKAAEIHYLIIDRHRKGADNEGIGLYVAPEVPVVPRFHRRVQEALAALRSGIQPRLTDDGTGATYFIKSSDKRTVIGVLKPKDEEAFAPQNPRGYVGKENCQGLRAGVFSTQQAAREVAAFLLDHDKNAGVPDTTLVHVRHPKLVMAKGEVVWKVAAFQDFVEPVGTAGDFSSSVFSTSNVHKIGILDVRILNLDRNDGNLLVRLRRRNDSTTKYELVPIDHGLSLPDRLEIGDEDIAWMSWPQAKKPFAAEELKYIHNLKPAQDDKTLKQSLGIRRECRRLCESATMVLQLFARANLTLYDIGRFIYRMDIGDGEQKSEFEKMVVDATDEMLMATMDKNAEKAVNSRNLQGLDLDVQSVQTIKSRVQEKKKRTSFQVSETCSNAVATPQLSPASPLSSPMSLRSSPNCTDPPHLSLEDAASPASGSDGCFGSDSVRPQTQREDGGGRGQFNSFLAQTLGFAAEFGAAKTDSIGMASTAAGSSSGMGTAGRYHGASFRGSTRRRNAVKETKGDDEHIFYRKDAPVSWSPEQEDRYRERLQAKIEAYIEKKVKANQADQPTAEPEFVLEVNKAEADSSLASAFPDVPADEARDSGGFFMCQKRGSFSSDTPAGAEADAPAALPAPRPGRYVPPHLRKAAAEASKGDAAAASSAGEPAPSAQTTPSVTDPTSLEPAPAPPRARYVPPQRRREATASSAEVAPPASDAADADAPRAQEEAP